MIDEWLVLLQASQISQALRASIWVYPLINIGHLLGIALLIGAIVPLDLRLLGIWPGVVIAPLARVLVPVAMAGLVIAVACGLAMFVSRPLDYAGAGIFQTKIGIVCAAALNAVLLHRTSAWHDVIAGGVVVRRVRWAVLVSLLAWPIALALGRLLGFR